MSVHSASWVVNIISLVSCTQSAPVFIHHLCLIKLPVSYYHYVRCDVRSLLVLYCHYTLGQAPPAHTGLSHAPLVSTYA